MPIIYLLILLLTCLACGPSVEDKIDRLGGSPDQAKEAKHELLLSKDLAVEPLIAALEDPRYTASHPELADLLVSLMMRVEDKRIPKALQRHLVDNPDPRVRQRIAYKMGVHTRGEFADAYLQALDDSSAAVRQQSVKALGLIENKLNETQLDRLRQKARLLAQDLDQDVRIEALFVLENYVAKLVEQARQHALKADLHNAQLLFDQALDYAPNSKRANYFLGQFYYENGQMERGLAVWRRHHLLLDVPLVIAVPQIDGKLDEEIWQQAAVADSFYQWGRDHDAAYLSKIKTTAYMLRSRDALYIGARCYDAHPESLLVATSANDQNKAAQDLVEFFFDPELDYNSHLFFNVNSVGAYTDAFNPGGHPSSRQVEWNADIEVDAFVGEDFWSVEYKLVLGQSNVPAPASGDIWGLNIQRGYRAQEWSQWVRTYTTTNFLTLGYLMFE